MSAADEASKVGMDLLRHASGVLQMLMTAGAYKLIKTYLSTAPLDEARATTSAVEEAGRKAQEEGQVLHTDQVQDFIGDVV
jgi:hypothetical protein